MDIVNEVSTSIKEAESRLRESLEKELKELREQKERELQAFKRKKREEFSQQEESRLASLRQWAEIKAKKELLAHKKKYISSIVDEFIDNINTDEYYRDRIKKYIPNASKITVSRDINIDLELPEGIEVKKVDKPDTVHIYEDPDIYYDLSLGTFLENFKPKAKQALLSILFD
jgi:vacuolar-type H+-ATPase subunit E/Vma4